MSDDKKECVRVHFIGIGGIGMSGLARYFLALSKGGKKWLVSGSDATKSPMTDELIKEGVEVKIGHKKANIPAGTGLVIYNRAIPSNNPELRAAHQNKGMVVMSYARALGRITEDYTTIAITGAHGKSTTTALAGLALMRGGLDPTILIGTKLVDLGGKNIRVGHRPYLVLEADDYGAAFLEYSPSISIVTNIDREHMDFYKNFTNVKRAFLQFLARTRPGGTLILNRDDVPLYSLKAPIIHLAKKNHLRVIWHSMYSTTSSQMAKKIKRIIPIPGGHNISNALAVAELGKVLKIPEKKILAAIGSYRGAWRRMEFKGKIHGALVYDDYAHHPAEIRATLAAFKEKFPHSPLVCVFQPHQAKRLELLFKDFTRAFDAADKVFILPIYKVLGRDEKFLHDSAALVRALQKRSPQKPIFYLTELRKIKTALMGQLTHSPVVVMMGAGDIADLTKKLLK